MSERDGKVLKLMFPCYVNADEKRQGNGRKEGFTGLNGSPLYGKEEGIAWTPEFIGMDKGLGDEKAVAIASSEKSLESNMKK
jgi:hypothetical protein